MRDLKRADLQTRIMIYKIGIEKRVEECVEFDDDDIRPWEAHATRLLYISLIIHPEGGSTNCRTLKNDIPISPRTRIGAPVTEPGCLKDPVASLKKVKIDTNARFFASKCLSKPIVPPLAL